MVDGTIATGKNSEVIGGQKEEREEEA